MSEQLDLVPREDRDPLLAEVLRSGNVEVLERFIALRNSEAERQARLNFEAAFAKLQTRLPPIKRTKEVKTRSGRKMYDYAPLEEIQSVVNPILQEYGFSYSWREEAIPDGKRTWFDLMNFGHVKSNYFDAPMLDPISSRDGDAVTNKVQAARSTSSYGKRNSLVDGLGLIVEGEDDDAQTVEIDDELKAALESIELSTNTDNLMTNYQAAWNKYKSDKNRAALVTGTYTIAKKRIIGK